MKRRSIPMVTSMQANDGEDDCSALDPSTMAGITKSFPILDPPKKFGIASKAQKVVRINRRDSVVISAKHPSTAVDRTHRPN
jgi:hypothetical protein